MKKSLLIRFVYIENTFVYKMKDFLRNKNQKRVIDFNNLVDKTIDKNLILKNKALVGSLILKKVKKVIHKNKGDVNIYYVLNNFNDEVISNIISNIQRVYEGDISYEIYTDSVIKVNTPTFQLEDIHNVS